MARVSVQDDGIGIPDDAQELVWERFQRIEGNAVQSGLGIGLGIGLYITRHIVEGHGGQVGLHSIVGQRIIGRRQSSSADQLLLETNLMTKPVGNSCQHEHRLLGHLRTNAIAGKNGNL